MTKTNTKKTVSKAATKSVASKPKKRPTSKLDQLQKLIIRNDGASIAEMCKATGWQQHSVRGALAGALKKRGLKISSEKIDDVRRYFAKATT